MSKDYFTRLTPNFIQWQKPSGHDGKCQSADHAQPLYEEEHGFGWEEWLFEEYYLNHSEPEHECRGFIQAFNGRNLHIRHLNRLYLYTKLCSNEKGKPPGCYYVGYINNVRRIGPEAKDAESVGAALQAVGIHHNNFLPMLPYALNISFKVKDVHLGKRCVFQQPIELQRGKYRFALYNLSRHHNFLTEINNYL
jgi:hypothetical protein